MQPEMDVYSSRTPLSTSSRSGPVPSASSKPMIIPVKGLRPSDAQKARHSRRGVPPAVAALLAVTTIPPPHLRKPGRRRKGERSYSVPHTPPPFDDADPIVGEEGGAILAKSPSQLFAPSARSALELLLSPPDTDDDGFGPTSMERSHSDGLLSVRSSSTESVPSLDTDSESTFSCSSSWSTPTSSRRRFNDPRARIVTSPPVECDLDHPLMFAADEEPAGATQEPAVDFLPEETLKRVMRRMNLVSNLTASIRVLKSAAKSFSNITASAAALQQPDDYLTRSILSITPQYRDERRPKPTEEEPTPALRRYLNPWSQRHEESPCTGAVQMQTYNISSRSRTTSAGRKENFQGDSCGCAPTVRQREVRENSDFLRVIVLEMNMRREGKLSDTAQGKARYILPPRQSCKLRVIGDPCHWEAWVCIYEG
jgi:hypothetical protein